MGHSYGTIESHLLEDASAAYVVRVWIERREFAATPVTWRGSIEHVASGEIKYMTDLAEIAPFIRPFLEGMDVRFGYSDDDAAMGASS